ncbi:hypothetical protein HLRTI_000510 [Halorhabdus tiamatea SARL4B]|uniref:Uncharacterized protein n=1 Tax=Halorhabdus tiamatea SARL4B TaxID=1033806 RepID=U2DPC9_9EURY|nr:hypothetical protein [Halorhabdus tiamatea]ERJ07467.1 hypothetical protein HLRTI_000510 [Halorhabdus tiamatea SARL4B]
MADEGNSTGGGPSPAPRQTQGKGRSQSGGGGRDDESYEDMEASDAAADDAQERLDEVEESADQDMEALLEELEQVQDQGPPAGGSGGSGDSGGPSPSNEAEPTAGDNLTSEIISGGTADADSGEGRAPPAGSWEGTPQTSQFARQVLAESAVADKHLDGDGEPNVSPPSEPDHSNRYGGFNEFSRDEIDEWIPIKSDTEEGRGATDAAKDRGELHEQGEHEYDVVYRTKYGSGEGRLSSDDVIGTTADDLKTNQMATYTFAESVGVETPRFTYDTDRDEVISEGVGDGNPTSIKDLTHDRDSLSDTDKARANAVDRQEFIDKTAVQSLAGNWDQTSDNLMIDDDGTVLTFDYDRSNREFGDFTSLTHVSQRAATTAQKLDSVRDDSNQLNITKEEIGERAAEIAYELEESGQDDVVVDAVESQMEAMTSQSQTSPDAATNHDFIQRNIEVGADVARKRFEWD